MPCWQDAKAARKWGRESSTEDTRLVLPHCGGPLTTTQGGRGNEEDAEAEAAKNLDRAATEEARHSRPESREDVEEGMATTTMLVAILTRVARCWRTVQAKLFFSLFPS